MFSHHCSEDKLGEGEWLGVGGAFSGDLMRRETLHPPPTPRGAAPCEAALLKGAPSVDSKGAWGVDPVLLASGGACAIRYDMDRS